MRPTDATRRVVSGAALAALALVCPRPPHAAEAPRLDLRLTAVAALPDDVRAALVDEVRHVWQRAGVRVEWVDGGSAPDAPALRVLVVSRAASTAAGRSEHSWPVAELLHDTEHRPVAIASIEAAWKVVAAAHAADEPARMRHHRLGLVLGRAVAHEVGHRLLGSAHSGRGLMRARISATEFADLRDGGFGLDRVAAAAALQRLAADRPSRSALNASY